MVTEKKKSKKSKKSKGHHKVEMKKTVEERRLLVTFSKLRFRLFRDASELCSLCGGELAIVVFSPYQRAFSFGHPDPDTVIDRFLTGNPLITDSAAGSSSITPVDDTNLTAQIIIDLNEELSGYLDLVQEEKAKSQWLDLIRSDQPKVWWEDPIEELTQEQLEELKEALGLLKANVIEEAQKFATENRNPGPIPGIINSLGGALPMENGSNINNPIELDP